LRVPLINAGNGYGRMPATAGPALPSPRAAYQPSGGGTLIVTSEQLEEALRTGNVSASGASVTPDSAMRVAAFYGGLRILCGPVANLPIDVKRRLDDKRREDASDTRLWKILRRRPNRWQTPSQFKRMLQAHVILRGNGYGLIVRSTLRPYDILEIIPLNPDRVRCEQNDDMSLSYEYTRRDGGRVRIDQAEMFHLCGLTLNGFSGVSVLTYARESIGESLAMADHGGTMFRNGARVSGMLTHPNKLGSDGKANLKASLDEFRAEGERDGKVMILEEGMKFERVALSAVDAQWIESRKFSRTDVLMFLGVPPFMVGDTEKNTSWGTGIEQMSNGFVTYTEEDWLTMWEEAIQRDLIADPDSNLYARFNRSALVKGDIKTRWGAHVQALQWGVMSPDEVRALEDMNPREDGKGGDYYDPPNAPGGAAATEPAPKEDKPDGPL
jgi:HK97 family phage portal protein